MDTLVEKIEHNGYTIEVHSDYDPMNPRTEFDNLGTMVCFHKRYDLGDKDHGYKSSDYDSWDELEKAIEKNEDVAVILPVYMYDHSGITINTTGFSCGWDSGQIGFIFVSKKVAKENFGWKQITAKRREQLKGYLKGEIETYDCYLSGQVYGHIVKDPDGEEVENGSCWGYFGYDHEKSGLKSECIATIEWHIKTKENAVTSLDQK